MSEATKAKESGIFGLVKNGLTRAGRIARTSFAVVGFVTVSALSVKAWESMKFSEDEKEEKKRVLVLPFHNLKLVNKADRLSWLKSQGDGDPVVEIEVHRLVNLIHEAAKDPSIVALYGKFGHGRGFAGGLAEAEEIRNGAFRRRLLVYFADKPFSLIHLVLLLLN